jgi:hypothetical protein
MSQLDRTVEVDHPVREATETARDAGAEVARTARDAGATVARTARDAGTTVARSARDAGADVAHTVGEEARQVAHTAADEAKQVGMGVRRRLREEVDHQHRQVVDRVGTFAEQLNAMAAERPDTPAGELVAMLATRSRSFAEYLDQHGPERVLHELQDFARRRPGTFIAAALAAGFVVGRLGKGLWQGPHESPRS